MKIKCVSCNGHGFRYNRLETGYMAGAALKCISCGGTGVVKAETKEI